MAAVLEEKTFRSLKEVAVLVFFAGSVFFLISLMSYNTEDAGWTHSSTAQSVTNAGGVVGAWLADFCFSFFGVVAYLLPFVIIRHTYLVYILAKEHRKKTTTILHWLGATIAIVSSAALFYLHILRVGVELPGNTGGIIGQEIGDALLLMCGNSGATVMLIASLLVGVTLATQMSWLTILDFIGKYSVKLVDMVGSCVLRFWEMARSQPRPAIVTGLDAPKVEAYFKPALQPRTSTPSMPGTSTLKNPVPEIKLPELTSTIFSPVDTASKQPQKQAQKQPSPIRSTATNGEVLPAVTLLDNRDTRVKGYTQTDLEEMSRLVEDILADFNVTVEVVGFLPGPVITRFELQPAAGVKVSRISSLSKDLARALSVTSVRIVEVIPGKSVIGLEIPNREREMVTLRELLASRTFEKSPSLLTLAMGKDISGQSLVADLGKMPHALVAGTTGSGKSVAINSMILSLLYKATPEQVRMIMIDPKMLELSVYEGIPHLLTPVVTDMKEAQNALRWAVAEMERRYKLMSKMGVRNLAGFNQLIEDAAANGKTIRDPMFQLLNPLAEGEDFPILETLPSIVIIIDELADMMMIVGKKVEELIARLAQKARAAGIHLILATQRPSVDVLTGLIKANVPTRISFQVSSRIDSRTILDQGGAEALLGNGDMLFLPSGTSIPIRAHGAFVDDNEVHRVVEFLKQTAPPNYLAEITSESFENSDGFGTSGSGYSSDPESDSLYDQAVEFVTQSRKASISSLQRRFKVGYNRAATMIEDMEAAGIVTPAETNGSRMVIAPPPVRD
ncbi:DNA translocase FtsK [Methyloglobulus morosus KoM1]|uniref:DNA translocase FtsK n=1 Tax=Methyloglobulus morosus KoM1 TaxID=1116472 RepID=V5BNB7_9GAMM|nr:DNA translocase FtsK [Methyloglobulus morosus]ESS69314.1 DNA translocase FtsK [Methyloglobulus morosus KoM1]